MGVLKTEHSEDVVWLLARVWGASVVKVDNRLIFFIEAESHGAEEDKDSSPEELHDAGQAEEYGQNWDGVLEFPTAGFLVRSALSSLLLQAVLGSGNKEIGCVEARNFKYSGVMWVVQLRVAYGYLWSLG